jgi:Family of unknown function (DUF6527)
VNRESCDMVRVATVQEVLADDAPCGTFCWQIVGDPGATYRVLHSKAPGGTFSSLAVSPAPADAQPWNWDGNEDNPTLTPSVYHNRGFGGQAEWHGHFTAGRMVSC